MGSRKHRYQCFTVVYAFGFPFRGNYKGVEEGTKTESAQRSSLLPFGIIHANCCINTTLPLEPNTPEPRSPNHCLGRSQALAGARKRLTHACPLAQNPFAPSDGVEARPERKKGATQPLGCAPRFAEDGRPDRPIAAKRRAAMRGPCDTRSASRMRAPRPAHIRSPSPPACEHSTPFERTTCRRGRSPRRARSEHRRCRCRSVSLR